MLVDVANELPDVPPRLECNCAVMKEVLVPEADMISFDVQQHLADSASVEPIGTSGAREQLSGRLKPNSRPDPRDVLASGQMIEEWPKPGEVVYREAHRPSINAV